MQWFENEHVTYDLGMSENGLKDILYSEGDIIASENGAPKKVGPRTNCPSCPPPLGGPASTITMEGHLGLLD